MRISDCSSDVCSSDLIVEVAEQEGLALPALADFDSVTGMGVRASVDGARVEVGADRYMRELGLDVGVFATTAARLGKEGKSPLYAAINGRLASIVADADAIKPSTLERQSKRLSSNAMASRIASYT